MTGFLAAPKVEVFAPRTFDGLVRRYTMQTRDRIPAQWADYDALGPQGPGGFFGISFGYDEADGGFDYLCGQEVTPGAEVPAGFGSVCIAGPHARFATSGHISTMQAAWQEVHQLWLARPEYPRRPGPWVEYYPPEFDGMTGAGGYELWVPVNG